ncbi:TadE/TadG family type IV pilus assembly protein [Aliagarivorans taiwanensis]|uniref:TadE/TadG family type IV pilus assembly protein n=1 Tax=Aliagarivorans taiwanensis TaxID=561966 RepID=UPI0003F4FFE9|nr:TadE family protein [Aliagarivorans taiwanensis]
MIIRRKSTQQGIVAIEFAIGGGVFFLFMFLIYELCCILYAVNLAESGLREASRDARTTQLWGTQNYYNIFAGFFESQDSLWTGLLTHGTYRFEVEYYSNLAQLAQHNGVSSCADCPFARYQISYDYTPLLLQSTALVTTIERSIITVQEFQGWEL